MARYVVNGKFLTRKITGVDRFAREVLLELDKTVLRDEIEILVPCGTKNIPQYVNIKVVQYGFFKGLLWEQFTLPVYAFIHGSTLINLCNVAPIFSPGVVCVCDMQIRTNPSFFSWEFVLWYRFLYCFILRFSKKILTISNFSKKEIWKYYPFTKNKMSIVYCAWQHMLRIGNDDAIFGRYPAIQKGEYFFAMSSMARNKNFKWIIEVAKKNPSHVFVVAGDVNTKIFGKVEIEEIPNVIKLGYVSDEEAKSLMTYCKAFLYPTFYEGFGMPPLEAMSCGARVVVSDTECMHEIYGDSVCYINPFDSDVDISVICSVEHKNTGETLEKYSWNRSAFFLKNVLSD